MSSSTGFDATASKCHPRRHGYYTKNCSEECDFDTRGMAAALQMKPGFASYQCGGNTKSSLGNRHVFSGDDRKEHRYMRLSSFNFSDVNIGDTVFLAREGKAITKRVIVGSYFSPCHHGQKDCLDEKAKCFDEGQAVNPELAEVDGIIETTVRIAQPSEMKDGKPSESFWSRPADEVHYHCSGRPVSETDDLKEISHVERRKKLHHHATLQDASACLSTFSLRPKDVVELKEASANSRVLSEDYMRKDNHRY